MRDDRTFKEWKHDVLLLINDWKRYCGGEVFCNSQWLELYMDDTSTTAAAAAYMKFCDVLWTEDN